jgi:drug/metabolite transporter (DMT)-like permease
VALTAALIFGATTPLASLLARALSPLWLAAALYLGVGLLVVRIDRLRRAPLAQRDLPWLLGSATVGGVVAPVLYTVGLRHTDAVTASLLLTIEPVATALIAWLVLREHASGRTVAGTFAIAVGAVVLAWRGSPSTTLGSLAIAGAAVAWAIDNNFTGRIASTDGVVLAGLKGALAAPLLLGVAALVRDPLPARAPFAAGIGVGLVGYGLSLALSIDAMRRLGIARASAYLATAPFLGAVLSLGIAGPSDPWRLGIAGVLMAVGVWLHVRERHDHRHQHDAGDHEHLHRHDAHHAHAHAPHDPPGNQHAHRHQHAAVTHAHEHAPDLHHRHPHGEP